MASLDINSIFYSKQNLGLAYELKRVCQEIGITVIYAFEIPELVRYLKELKIGVIFIDCTTLKLNENIISFIKSYSNSKSAQVVLITDAESDCKEIENSSQVNYVIKSDNLLSQLKKIENELIYHVANSSEPHLNYSEINSYLTNYLISIGIVPKHIGFTYIKQIVELALKNNGILGSLSTEYYTTVANKNKTLPQNVERNIRNCIECACKSQEIQKDNIRFLLSAGKISNRAFLSYVLDKVVNTYLVNN